MSILFHSIPGAAGASKGGSMITQLFSYEPLTGAETGHTYLCMHGHFYQPPREDPFTYQLPDEPGAALLLTSMRKSLRNVIVRMPRLVTLSP